MRIDHAAALQRLEHAVALASKGEYDRTWYDATVRLAAACDGKSQTNIAALGTALLAKATTLEADPYALKVGDGTKTGAYSARSLCQHVLAAHAPRLGINIGTTGREPLNNQPFFGKDRIGPHLLPIVKKNAQAAFGVLLECLALAAELAADATALAALAGYVAARGCEDVRAGIGAGAGDSLSPTDLLDLVVAFTGADAESGKRAQAIVAALMDVRFGADRVLVSKVHDPDRHFPGDVAVVDAEEGAVQMSLEVRDKPVAQADLYHTTLKVEPFGARQVGVVAVGSNQSWIDPDDAREWAWRRGVFLRVWLGWADFIDEALFWVPASDESVVGEAYRRIYQRAVQLEVAETGILMWETGAEGEDR